MIDTPKQKKHFLINRRHADFWQEAIRKTWETATTEELLKIWKGNDRRQWSDEHFEVLRKVLIERGAGFPEQERKKERGSVEVFCMACGSIFTAIPTISFLGFRRFRCPACNTHFQYPLVSSRENSHKFEVVGPPIGFLVLLMVRPDAATLIGYLIVLVLFAIGLYALVKDALIKRTIASAKKRRNKSA